MLLLLGISVVGGGGGCVEGRDRDKGDPEVADLGESAVQLRLVGHEAAEGGGGVALVGDREAADQVDQCWWRCPSMRSSYHIGGRGSVGMVRILPRGSCSPRLAGSWPADDPFGDGSVDPNRR